MVKQTKGAKINSKGVRRKRGEIRNKEKRKRIGLGFDPIDQTRFYWAFE
jgi:hypothetical protein